MLVVREFDRSPRDLSMKRTASLVTVVSILIVLLAPNIPVGAHAAISQHASTPQEFAERFEQQFGMAVLDEDCQQTVFSAPAGFNLHAGPYTLPPRGRSVRRSRSEMLLMWREHDGWLVRRRVLLVDGRRWRPQAPQAFKHWRLAARDDYCRQLST